MHQPSPPPEVSCLRLRAVANVLPPIQMDINCHPFIGTTAAYSRIAGYWWIDSACYPVCGREYHLVYTARVPGTEYSSSIRRRVWCGMMKSHQEPLGEVQRIAARQQIHRHDDQNQDHHAAKYYLLHQSRKRKKNATKQRKQQ